MKYLPKHEDVLSIGYTPILPPLTIRNNIRHTLVLDLDETLVHCSIEPLNNYNLKFNVDFNGINYNVNILIKAGLCKVQTILQAFSCKCSQMLRSSNIYCISKSVRSECNIKVMHKSYWILLI